jgi:Arc/MetJ-type ribon-helix-helix transcriptional regulator
MPKAEILNATLPAEVAAIARGAVERGLYSSVEDVVSDAIRHRAPGSEDVEGLRQAWPDAMDDPGPGEPMEAVMDRCHAKYSALYAQSEASSALRTTPSRFGVSCMAPAT